MAIPMSLARSAGASLMPSPVIATTCPADLRALTMVSLSSGVTRAKTAVSGRSSQRRSAVKAASSRESRHSSPGPAMPSSWATAIAVPFWSPVTITVRMPAPRSAPMASFTPARGGSISPTIPTHTSSSSALVAASPAARRR